MEPYTNLNCAQVIGPVFPELSLLSVSVSPVFCLLPSHSSPSLRPSFYTYGEACSLTSGR